MKKIYIAIILSILLFEELFASIEIISVLPNPLGDDALGEYIEIRNTSCFAVDISGYTLSDLSGKSYTIPASPSLGIHENKRFPYSETKISLNNSSIETIILRDRGGSILDELSYSGIQKDNIILFVGYTDDSCEEVQTDSGILLGTGGLDTDSSGDNQAIDVGTGEIVSSSGDIHSMSDVEQVSIIDSGSIESGSGIIFILSGTTGSGILDLAGPLEILPQIPSGTPSQGTGIIKPVLLSYADTDNNQKIDTLEILYNETITGSIDVSNIALYSKSGGLSYAKIDTSTGYFIAGYTSGNILLLKMKEGDLEKTSLSINNSTSSDLRLKSIDNIGITTVDGRNLEDFFLTHSFDEYRNVKNKTDEAEMENLESHTIGSEIGISTLIGDMYSGEIMFPEIIPTLQSPTNATLSGTIFICNQKECRINITLSPIFQSGIYIRDFTCLFGTGSDNLVFDNDCNPDTYYFTSKGNILLKVISKKENKEVFLDFPVEFFLTNESSKEDNDSLDGDRIDTGKPVANIFFDGKWKEYYEQVGDFEMNCYAFTCSMNFSAEKSYDPEGSTIRYLWIYGQNHISTKRDPGSIQYTLGDHRMILRVIDEAGNFDEVIYIIHVLGKKAKQEIQKKLIPPESELRKTASSRTKTPKRKYKKIQMEFYSDPIIFLQGKTGEKYDHGKYRCIIKRAKTCQMNFVISGALSSFEYHWILDGDEIFRGKNPKAWHLKPGIHTGIIEIYRKGSNEIYKKQEFTISVLLAGKKSKKNLKAEKVSKKLPKQSSAIIPVANAGNNDVGESPYSNISGILFMLMLGLGFGFFLRGK